MHDNDKVTKANHIIEAQYSFTIREMKFVAFMISLIRPEDQDLKYYRLSVKDVLSSITTPGEEWGDGYSFIRGIVKSIQKKPLVVKTNTGTLDISWVSSVETFERGVNKGLVEFEFSEKVKPYLLQLREKFTTYHLKYVVQLKSIFSIRIYELLKQYEKIGKRTIEINEFKFLLNIAGKYPNTKDLKRRVLDVAQAELAEKTDVSFSYELIKKGRVVQAIEFLIKREPPAADSKLNPIPDQKDDTSKEFLGRLVSFGVSKKQAVGLLGKYDQVVIEQWIDCLSGNYIKGVTNRPGYLVTALQKGFNFPPTYMAHKNQKVSVDTQKKREDRRKNCPICKGEGGFYQDVVIDDTTYSSWENCSCMK